MLLVVALTIWGVVVRAESDWKPMVSEIKQYHVNTRSYETRPQIKFLHHGSTPLSHQHVTSNNINLFTPSTSHMHDTCSMFKVSMNQELPRQYVQYETEIPDLKEFTLCMWKKFHNHSSDHPLFSYSVNDNLKEISAWISNTQDASYFSLAVHGQTFFRLNYPLKLNTWYHSCQSWNGKTGEWQLWVNAERVGRGFHNRLVNHVIKGKGLAISGQEQSIIFDKDFIEPNPSHVGLLGEITMLQLYHVALTAGKAHKDHKHHHVHHFRLDGTPVETSTEAETEAPPPQATPLGNGNFLIGGQLQRAPQLNLAGGQQMIPVQLPNGLQLQQEYVNGQLGKSLVSEQLLNSAQPLFKQSPAAPPYSIGPISDVIRHNARRPYGMSKGSTYILRSSVLNPANVQYVEDSSQHNLFKRTSKRDTRDNPKKDLNKDLVTGKKDKRELVALSDGSLVDEALISSQHINPTTDAQEELMFQQSLLDGLAGFVGNRPVQDLQKETVDEREPAEAEVKAVMIVCSGCVPEPFQKAVVIAWRFTSKKLYSGAHYYKGLPICRAF